MFLNLLKHPNDLSGINPEPDPAYMSAAKSSDHFLLDVAIVLMKGFLPYGLKMDTRAAKLESYWFCFILNCSSTNFKL